MLNQVFTHLQQGSQLITTPLQSVLKLARLHLAFGAGNQFLRRKRFVKIVICAEVETERDVGWLASIGRHKNRRDIGCDWIFTQSAENLEAIHTRHSDIEQDKIGN